MRRIAPLLALIAIALALGSRSPGAEAHAFLTRSQPAAGSVLPQPPVEVLLWFTEDIEVKFSDGQVVDATGTRYDNGDWHQHADRANAGMTLAEMPNGTYTAIFDVLSAVDGHRTKGAVSFFVGPPGSQAPGIIVPPPDLNQGSLPPDWLEVSVRWFNFAAMAALIGAVLFPFLILRRGFSALSDAAAEDTSTREEAERRAAATARVSVLVAAGALLLGGLLSLWVQVWAAGGSASETGAVEQVLRDSRFGEIWTFRIALVAIIAISAVVLVRQRGIPWRESIWERGNSAWLLLAGLAVAIPGTTSLNSHAAASSSGVFATTADWIHLVAGGIWVGGLVQLAVVVVAVVPKLEERPAFFGGLIRRFSLVAVISVCVIVATGVFQSIERLGGIDELVDTTYGSTLLVKVLLLTPLLGIAAFNLILVGPRFVSLGRRRGGGMVSTLWEARFRLAVSGELAIAATILAITAVLTSTSPPGPATGAQNGTQFAPPGSQAVSQQAEDLKIQIWATPGRVGVNDFNVILSDTNGDERAVQRVILRTKYLEDDLGVAEVDAEPFHPPIHYLVNTPQFSLPGNWEVEVIVRREGVLDARTTFTISIGA